jgi:hypothetical protein
LPDKTGALDGEERDWILHAFDTESLRVVSQDKTSRGPRGSRLRGGV